MVREMGAPGRCLLLAALLAGASLPTPSLARMCVGTNIAMSRVGQTTEDNYIFYKNMYTGESFSINRDPAWFFLEGGGKKRFLLVHIIAFFLTALSFEPPPSSGCTYVDGNLEITHMDGPDAQLSEKYDFSFLNQIEEIKGYLLIFHVEVPFLPFDNLKIIRGQTLFGESRLHGTYGTSRRGLDHIIFMDSFVACRFLISGFNFS